MHLRTKYPKLNKMCQQNNFMKYTIKQKKKNIANTSKNFKIYIDFTRAYYAIG